MANPFLLAPDAELKTDKGGLGAVEEAHGHCALAQDHYLARQFRGIYGDFVFAERQVVE